MMTGLTKQELLEIIAHNKAVNKKCYEAIKSMEGGQPSGSIKKKKSSEAAAQAVANRQAFIMSKAKLAS